MLMLGTGWMQLSQNNHGKTKQSQFWQKSIDDAGNFKW